MSNLFSYQIPIKLQINSDNFSNPAQNGLLIINGHFRRKIKKVKDFHIICNDNTVDSTTSVKYLYLIIFYLVKLM